jgi:asparagine synthase (glutamine-hydrolysing)
VCGIAGIVGVGDGFPRSDALITAMCDAIAHRGPDDSGIWSSDRAPVTLGHRRLSIVDLSAAGHQPMANEDGTVWLTFNGEIYNHAALRAELAAAGHRFASHTDSEVIVHLYEQEGPACVERLEGMFALGIWDERARTLLLARDRLGVKPLYYARRPSGFLFASEAKALLTHPSVSAGAAPAALAEFLCFGAVRAPHTAFAGIEKLAPAERLVLILDGCERRERYWSPLAGAASAIDPSATDGELEQALLAHLRRSIRMRLMSDVPLGVFLSGGVDSSTNVALVAEATGGRVQTFSVTPEGPGRYDESRYAALVARAYDTDHHALTMTEADFIAELPSAVRHHDEPIADWSCVPCRLLARLAREQGTEVIQLGEGSDEIFHGYSEWRYGPRLLDGVARLPGPVRRRLAAPALHALGGRTPLPTGALSTLYEAARSGVGYWGGALAVRPLLLERVLGPWAMDDARAVAGVLPVAGGADLMQHVSAVELAHRLPEILLMRVDKMLMAEGVEGREPFLDHRLVEFAFALPPRLKRRGGEGKLLLRRAVAGLLPPEILARPKQGFSTPVSEWLRGDLGDRLARAIAGSELVRGGVLRPAAVDAMWVRHRAGEDWSAQLWQIATLALWHSTWCESGAPTLQEW